VFLKMMKEIACRLLAENNLAYALKEKRTKCFAQRFSSGMAGDVRAAERVAIFRSITRSREAASETTA
jgi:hypothetical protein